MGGCSWRTDGTIDLFHPPPLKNLYIITLRIYLSLSCLFFAFDGIDYAYVNICGALNNEVYRHV